MQTNISTTLKKLSLSPRLKSKTLIDKLFTSKKSKVHTVYPVRMVCLDVDGAPGASGGDNPECCPVQVLFSVSKRHFKHAVDRNRIKRQMREAYRHCCPENAGSGRERLAAVAPVTQRLIAFIWLADKHFDSKRVDYAVSKALEKLC